MDDDRPGESTEAIDEFLSDADEILEEYDEGYLDADAAISRIEVAVETLRDGS